MKTEVVAVGAPKHLIDLSLDLDVDGVLGLFDDRIQHDESAAVFQHPQNFPNHAGGIAEMVQAERNKSPVEGVGLERQLIRLSGALRVLRNRILVLMADVE